MPHVKIGLIGGTGLGDALGAERGTPHDVETPFGRPAGPVVELDWHGLPVCVLQRHGRGHLLNPSQVPYQANVFALKQLGCTHVLASGAVGSLREEFKPRDLVIPDQLIDKTHTRDNTFYERAAVHVEFAEPFCPTLRRLLVDVGTQLGTTTHGRGCYVAMEGPQFSTRAESLMHRLWGGDLIGMTAMPEAKLAREAELPYALVALVTDYDCWRVPPKPAMVADQPVETAGVAKPPDAQALLAEILGHLQAATANAVALMRATVERIAADPSVLDDCPATRALELAIWSDKAAIDPAEVERLRPLWGRHFARD